MATVIMHSEYKVKLIRSPKDYTWMVVYIDTARFPSQFGVFHIDLPYTFSIWASSDYALQSHDVGENILDYTNKASY